MIRTSVFLVLLPIATLQLVKGEYYKPQILGKFERTFNASDDFTLTCQGNKPLRWDWPHVNTSQTKFQVKDLNPIDPKYKFASQLLVWNITYPFVGYYYCYHKDSSPGNERNSDSTYIYVSDDENLSVNPEDLETVYAVLDSVVTIPCRPTSLDVNVTLMTNYAKEIDSAIFDRKVGFLLNITDLQLVGTCMCHFKTSTNEFIKFVDIQLTENSLGTPVLNKISQKYTVVGQALEITCSVSTITSNIIFQWELPERHLDDSIKIDRETEFSERLIIENTTQRDAGIYRCNVSDVQSHVQSSTIEIEIYGVNDHFINLTEENGVYDLSVQAGEPSAQWTIDVDALPDARLEWFNNQNKSITIGLSEKYETNISSIDAYLSIKNISIFDHGYYTLRAKNKFETKSRKLFLNVTDKPTVEIHGSNIHMINSKSKLKCVVTARPAPKVFWEFKPCRDNSCNFTKINKTTMMNTEINFISYAELSSIKKSGFVRCLAENSLGSGEYLEDFIVSDVENGFDIFGIEDTVDFNTKTKQVKIASGDTISMTCGASLLKYSSIEWMFNNNPISDNQKLQTSSTNYSIRKTLIIPNANSSHNGLYSCQVKDIEDKVFFKNLSYYVEIPFKPIISKSNLNKDIEMNIPDALELFCSVTGLPKPTLQWYKNDKLFQPDKHTKMIVEYNQQKIAFKHTKIGDEGTYKCEAVNRLGTTSKSITVKFSNLPVLTNPYFLIIIVVLALLFIAALIYIAIKKRKERKLENELRKMGLENFEKGAIQNFNPDLGIDDQAELLPYDKKWEFAIENLKLGKQLGSGAFGVVMKGVARNIIAGEESSTVAVKMVKRNADNTYIKALASELKIMVHLGQHVNVVNLLGACTKNVVKKELLVIVEYCIFGNLHNYLLRHRHNFINQVNSQGKMDFNIGAEILERTYSVSSNQSTQSPTLKYAALAFSDSNSSPTTLQPPKEMADYRANGSGQKPDNVSYVPNNCEQSEDGMVLSNNSIQPDWRSNYRGDYKGQVQPISSKDLVAWAFQVARGMDYLASRKVMHGDLAARNILLAENNVVKICDFGLAKSMYKNDNYKKKGDGPLPIKWMAIESIRDRVFSTQSDVWSFGIVLWEFFSLARTPYPGMEADERLYHKLVGGYRMDPPEYASKEIYNMMMDCWQALPLTRPSFPKLVEQLGNLLESNVKKYYIDLNDPYLVMNTQRLEDGQSDYLAMLSPPDFENLSTPQYMNSDSNQVNDSDYLCMNQSIFSPRVEEDTNVFNFGAINKKPNSSAEGTGHELRPMLHKSSESGYDSPTTPDCFSNPSYHSPPQIPETTTEPQEIVKSSDNYVNMPQNKSAIKETNNNPFNKTELISDKTKPFYVNSISRDLESINV